MNALRNALGFLLVGVTATFSQVDQKRLGWVDFFGYKGLDVERIRAALPIQPGDPFPGGRDRGEWVRVITESVTNVIGRGPTDVGAVCCNQDGDWILYLGLPGSSFTPVPYNRTPSGTSTLPANMMRLYDEIAEAIQRAVMRGDDQEDRSHGYSLVADPDARAKQLAFRDQVLHEEPTTFRVLTSSSDSRQRAVAADALGYAHRSNRQIAALVQASLDPDAEVRNNAVRAVGVLVEAFPQIARRIPIRPYVALLSSGVWEDHNKASLVLEASTRSRDAVLLTGLRRASTLDSLAEMARWRNLGHAYGARMILGRIGGIEETDLAEMAEAGQVDTIINAARARMP